MSFVAFAVFLRICMNCPTVYIDEFWAEINAVIEDLGIHRFQPDNLSFQSDRVGNWRLRKTQENIDRFVSYLVSLVKLSYHANVVEASREAIAALNRVKRFRYSWETGETVKVPESYLQLINDFAELRMARFQHTAGQSRQFTIEEIQAFSPFESNDVSVDELRASVNLEGEDPQDVLQYVNIIPLVELPEEQAALDEEMIEGTAADVNVEPKVEESEESAAVPDSNMGTDDAVPGLATTSVGVNALPSKPEPDQHMMEIEAQVVKPWPMKVMRQTPKWPLRQATILFQVSRHLPHQGHLYLA